MLAELVSPTVQRPNFFYKISIPHTCHGETQPMNEFDLFPLSAGEEIPSPTWAAPSFSQGTQKGAGKLVCWTKNPCELVTCHQDTGQH